MPAEPTVPPAAQPLGPDEMLDRLGRSLAHNLNNRLTGVIGYLELALQEPGMPAQAVRHLRSSLDCALEVVRMLRRVVTFALRQPSLTTLDQFAPLELLEQAVAALRQRAPRLDVRIICEVEDTIPGQAQVVSLALEQLLDNAADALPQGGVVTVRLWQEETKVHLTVHDEGAGLSPAARVRMFEPFFSTRSVGHLGLGLPLARVLMEAVGGEVEVVSDPGMGTTATLVWPATVEAVVPPGSPKVLPPGVRVDPGAGGLGPPTRRAGSPVVEMHP